MISHPSDARSCLWSSCPLLSLGTQAAALRSPLQPRQEQEEEEEEEELRSMPLLAFVVARTHFFVVLPPPLFPEAPCSGVHV